MPENTGRHPAQAGNINANGCVQEVEDACEAASVLRAINPATLRTLARAMEDGRLAPAYDLGEGDAPWGTVKGPR